MSAYLGDFRTGKTIRKMWNSFAVAGESITRGTNGTVQVYKDGGTSQSTAGVTDTEDFDSLTGVHLVVIDTSADGTFYSAGSDFEVVVAGAVIDSKTINAVLFSFSLEARSALMPTTDGRKIDVSAGGEAGIDWANIGSPTTVQGLSGTTVKTATDVETDTADIQSRIPAALVSGRIDASVGAMAANVVTASAVAADAVTEIQSGLSTLDAAGVRSAVGLASANLDTQIDALPTAAENATAVWANGTRTLSSFGTLVADIWGYTIETGWTAVQALRVVLSSAAAKLSGAGTTTVTIRDAADTKARITATVDSSGNRTAVTYDKD